MIAKKNSYLIVMVGQFNAKSSNQYKHDKTTYGSSKIYAITSNFGLQQLIQETNYLLSNSSSCIDLVKESRVHSSLHENCHHQLVYAKLNLKVGYPPLDEKKIFYNQHANVD